jgi:hypothetical protein
MRAVETFNDLRGLWSTVGVAVDGSGGRSRRARRPWVANVTTPIYEPILALVVTPLGTEQPPRVVSLTRRMTRQDPGGRAEFRARRFLFNLS